MTYYRTISEKNIKGTMKTKENGNRATERTKKMEDMME